MNDLVQVLNNTQLQEIEARKAQEQADAQAKATEQLQSNLSGRIRKDWEAAKRAKIIHEQRMLKAKRAHDGVFDSTKLSAIKQMFGADYEPIYMMLTNTKDNAAIDWLKDIILRPDGEAFDLEPTPIPDLHPQAKAYIEQQFRQSAYNAVINHVMQNNLPVNAEWVDQQVNQMIETYYQEKLTKEEKRLAKDASDKMKQQIDDKFVEGRWEEAIANAITDLVIYPACIVKGPVLRKEMRRQAQVNEMTGQVESKIAPGIMTRYECRSPFDIYPAPDSVGVDDSYLIDKITITRKDLSLYIGLPGFKEEAIRTVLRQHSSGGLHEWTQIDTERAQLEGRDTFSIYTSQKIDCLEYWGTAPGSELINWAGNAEQATVIFQQEVDPDMEYHIAAWLIGTEIIKAMLNPDPIGKKPFSKASFVEDPHAFWGKGLPEIIWPHQRMLNQIALHIHYNVGIASGPQVELNEERMGVGETGNIYPWKIWRTTNKGMQESPAVKFYMPPMIADRLSNLFQFFLDLADIDSGIPRYQHGESNITGAGKTASGLSMLMTASSKRIKSVIKNLDHVIKTTVERQYHYILDNEELDFEIFCDMEVVPKGAFSLIAKEQQSIRRREFLAETNNPTDLQILTIEGRKKMLQEVINSNEMDLNLEELWEEQSNNAVQQPMGMQQLPMAPGRQIQQKPASLQGGTPQGGQDFTLYQQEKM